MSGKGQKKAQNRKSASGPGKKNKSKAVVVVAAGRKFAATPMNIPKGMLSACTRKYLRAVADPFSDEADGACIPDLNPLPTRKVKYWVRGNGQTGSGGLGVISICPRGLCYNDALLPVLASTSTTWNTDAVPIATAAGLTAFQSNSDGTTASYVAGQKQGRIVSVGVRVQGIGTMLNAGGTLCGIVEKNHTSLGGKTYAQLRAYDYTRQVEFDHRCFEMSLAAGGVDPYELTFQASTLPATYCMAIMIQSAAVDQKFTFEVIAHVELLGSNVLDTSRSPVDPVGYAAANEAVSESQDGSTLYEAASAVAGAVYNRLERRTIQLLNGMSHGAGLGAMEAAMGAAGVGLAVRGVRRLNN